MRAALPGRADGLGDAARTGGWAARAWCAQAARVYRDPHLQCAVLLAFPVWAALASGIGGRLYRPESAAAWLGFVLWQPLLEEMLFRGLLQGWLLRMAVPGRIAGISAANGISTATFVAMHVPTQPLAWALAVAGPSLLFGHLRERLHSVWPAVLLHAFYNAGFAIAASMTV